VVAVYDGDTLKIQFPGGSERRVRLIGIDTPELSDEKEETRLEARLARRFAFHYLYRKKVELTYEQELEDKYGRLLAYVWIEGALFNEFILKQGFARVFWAFPYSFKERFIRAQQEAREKGRGFWQKKPYPVVPAQDIRAHIGELGRVRFICARVRRRTDFLFLDPEEGDFAVLIPDENLSFFPGWKSWKGRALEAGGFLEEYRNQPQIMVFFPSQLRMRGDENPQPCSIQRQKKEEDSNGLSLCFLPASRESILAKNSKKRRRY
jgi:micrococcal nuclease